MLQEHMPHEDNTIHAELCTKVQAGYENSKCFTLGHQKLASRCFDKPVTIVLGPKIITIIQISWYIIRIWSYHNLIFEVLKELVNVWLEKFTMLYTLQYFKGSTKLDNALPQFGVMLF
jgi:hypothetical protein